MLAQEIFGLDSAESSTARDPSKLRPASVPFKLDRRESSRTHLAHAVFIGWRRWSCR